jgi:hypothetical protein
MCVYVYCVCVLCVCVCVLMFDRLFLFLAHKSLAILRYELTLAVDIERWYASKSGAGGAGVVFLWPKSLGLLKFETYSFERFRESIRWC